MDLNLSNLPGAFGAPSQPANTGDNVELVDVDLLDEFPGHPYSVNDDEAMSDLAESVRLIGVATPLLIRPAGNRYQVISGHRRLEAARRAGLDHVPAIIRDMDDDTAVITMVDSNKARTNIPLSEQAKAMRMRHDAILHQGARSADGKTTRQRLGEENESSEKTAARLVQLGRLDDGLIRHLDDKSLPARSGLQLVSAKPATQRNIANWLAGENGRRLGEEQAMRLRSLDEEQAEPLDPGLIATVAVQPKRDNQYVRVPVAWLPAGLPADERQEWVRHAIEQCRAHGAEEQEAR